MASIAMVKDPPESPDLLWTIALVVISFRHQARTSRRGGPRRLTRGAPGSRR
jgi:hypothetical protein